MPKVIRSDVRELVIKVKEFFKKEREAKAPIIPFKRVNERVAAATGISLRTIIRISNEGPLAEASGSKITTTGKNRKIRKDKIVVDDFVIGVLRRKVHEFNTMNKKEIPTLKKLHCILKEEVDFQGSREILRQLLKKIGYEFQKTRSNPKVLMEQAIKRNEETDKLPETDNLPETDKLPVIYLDETYL